MVIGERYKYLRQMRSRYVNASRRERTQLLNEMEAVIGQHRKSLMRLVNTNLKREPRR